MPDQDRKKPDPRNVLREIFGPKTLAGRDIRDGAEVCVVVRRADGSFVAHRLPK